MKPERPHPPSPNPRSSSPTDLSQFYVTEYLQHSKNGTVMRLTDGRQDLVAKVRVRPRTREEEEQTDDPELARTILRALGPHDGIVEQVDHPHDPTGVCVSVTKFLPGGDLFEVVKRGGLDEFRIGKWFSELANTLRELHFCGIAHLDLSLENMLYDPQSQRIKLCDFGLACRVWRNTQGQELSMRQHRELGKFYCQAPEAWNGKPFRATQADVYSFGMCLLVAYTQQHPYQRPDWTDRDFVSFYYHPYGVVRYIKKIGAWVPPGEIGRAHV